MHTSPRYVAYKILHKVESEGGFSNISLSHEIRNSNFSELDKGFLTELTYGVIERKVTLDYFISRFSSVPVRKMNIHVLILLRISAYQLAFMSKVPDYSICDETVKIAKRVIPVNAGFINAVVRSMSSEPLKVPNYSKKSFHSFTRYLSVKHSMPEWLIDRWQKIFGHESLEKLFNAMNNSVRFEIRANRMKTNVEKLKESLELNGFKTRKSSASIDTLIVENPSGIIRTSEFKDGLFYIQDSAASLASIVLNPSSNDSVLDACSAPGGKSTHIAEIMNNEGEVIASDVYPHKLTLIEENFNRLGISCIKTVILDATLFKKEFENHFDKILLDVPCTGLGLLSRKPEIRWSRSESDFIELNVLQKKILENCSKYLKVGGVLVYSTCSLDETENLDIISSFVKGNSNFEFADFEILLPDSIKNRGGKDGCLTLFPHIDNTDGFFISKIRRIS